MVIRPVHNKVLLEAAKAHEGVDVVVAPYEADAQLAFLALSRRVHAVISEDSDLLAYGCPRVLFKMGKDGWGEEICCERLPENKPLSFVGFSHQMLLEMCVLSGCDFLPSLKGIGVKKAHTLMKRFRHFVRAVKHLRYNGTHVPRGYEDEFHRALLVFKHQRVWDSEAGVLRHLEPIPEGGLSISLQRGADGAEVAQMPADCVDLDFLGAHMDDDTARGIAVGDVNPHTLELYPPVEEMLAGGRMEPPETANARRLAQQSRARASGPRQAEQGPLGKFYRKVGESNAAPSAGEAAGPATTNIPAPESKKPLPFWRRSVRKGLQPVKAGQPKKPVRIEHLSELHKLGGTVARAGSKRVTRPLAEKAKRSKFFAQEDSQQLPCSSGGPASQNTLDLDLDDGDFEVQVSQVSPPPADGDLALDLGSAAENCRAEGQRAFEKIKAQAAFSRFACEGSALPLPATQVALNLVDNGCRKPFNSHKQQQRPGAQNSAPTQVLPGPRGGGNVFNDFGCGPKK